MSLKLTYVLLSFFSIFCNLLSWCAPNFLPQHQAAFGDIDGASPTHSPKSGWECPHRWRKSFIPPDNRPNKNMPHRWRISFHPEEGICPKNRACSQTIPKHIDGASQAMAWWWGQKPVSKCVCHCQPSSACRTAMFGTPMDGAMRTKFCLQMCLQMPTFLGLLRDVGRYEGLAPSIGHSEPDFGEWIGLAPSMSPYSARGSNLSSVFLGFAPRGRTREPYLDFLLCVRVAQTQGKKKKHFFEKGTHWGSQGPAAWCWGRKLGANQLRRLQKIGKIDNKTYYD